MPVPVVSLMIENPADLIVIRIALQDAIARSRNPRYVDDAKVVLEKVERLEAQWIHRRATRPPRRGSHSGPTGDVL